MLDADDQSSLALLYHLNSEPSLNAASLEHETELDERRGVGTTIALPEAAAGSELLALIRSRASCRQFAPAPLSLVDLAALLVGTYGTTRRGVLPSGYEMSTKAVPSAGALYPLELYVVLEQVEGLDDGLYRYDALEHGLEPLQPRFDRAALSEVFLDAPVVDNANVILFVSAVFDRTLFKYGARGYRYILFEAGHAAQNLCLLAAERGLGSLCVGGFRDAALNRLLELDPRAEAVVYCVGVGHPAATDAP